MNDVARLQIDDIKPAALVDLVLCEVDIESDPK